MDYYKENSKKNRIYSLDTGEGKTSVMIPFILMSLDKNKTVFYVTLS